MYVISVGDNEVAVNLGYTLLRLLSISENYLTYHHINKLLVKLQVITVIIN